MNTVFIFLDDDNVPEERKGFSKEDMLETWDLKMGDRLKVDGTLYQVCKVEVGTVYIRPGGVCGKANEIYLQKLAN